MNWSTETIVAVLAFAGALIGNLLQFLNNRSTGKKAEAEANVALIDIALKLNRAEFDSLRLENKEMKEERVLLNNRLNELEGRLKEALFKLNDLMEERDVLKLSLESVQCELDVQKDLVKELKNAKKEM